MVWSPPGAGRLFRASKSATVQILARPSLIHHRGLTASNAVRFRPGKPLTWDINEKVKALPTTRRQDSARCNCSPPLPSTTKRATRPGLVCAKEHTSIPRAFDRNSSNPDSVSLLSFPLIAMFIRLNFIEAVLFVEQAPIPQ